MIECFLQTNSTVTTTVFQQASGVSLLDLPVTDWITAISSVIMVAVTVALVYYGHATIEEGNKTRRIESIERQLEKLYNPLFEILDGAEVIVISGDKYRRMIGQDLVDIRSTILNYGHYVGSPEHDMMKRLISGYPVAENPDVYHQACLDFVRQRRSQLMIDLQKLT